MGVAIIGTGAIASVHAECISTLGLPIVGVSGINEEETKQFVEKFKVVNMYTNYLDLLNNPNIDAVIVATPSATHAKISEAVIRSGRSLLCEIPVSLDFSSYSRVDELASKSDKLVAVAHTLRYSPIHIMLKDILIMEKLKPSSVLIRTLMFRQKNIGWTGAERDWTDSVLWHHGAHAVDLGLWLLEPSRPQVDLKAGPNWLNKSTMEVFGNILSEDGRFATINLSYHSRHPKNDVLVITESSTFEIVDGVLLRNGEQLTPSLTSEELLRQAVLNQDRLFLEAVRSGNHSGVYTVKNARTVMESLGSIKNNVSD